jgi:hypothetical protein
MLLTLVIRGAKRFSNVDVLESVQRKTPRALLKMYSAVEKGEAKPESHYGINLIRGVFEVGGHAWVDIPLHSNAQQPTKVGTKYIRTELLLVGNGWKGMRQLSIIMHSCSRNSPGWLP